MAEKDVGWHKRKGKKVVNNGGSGIVWLLGFVGALAYYLHFHSGTLWLVILAILKAIVWPAILVYHLLMFLRV